METHFRHSLVLSWAVPADVLEPMLGRGLELDTYTDSEGQVWGFVAAALVQLDQLRPRGVPARPLGLDAFGPQVMAGYRIFCRMQTPQGKTMRGLRILGSQATSTASVLGANLTTRYQYSKVQARVTETAGSLLRFMIMSADGSADVDVTAHLDDRQLPAGTVFADPAAARRFAGPLPYTFSPDPEGIVVVKSSRSNWHPQLVAVDVAAVTFFDHGDFAAIPRRLANAFYVGDLDYGWQPGVLHRFD